MKASSSIDWAPTVGTLSMPARAGAALDAAPELAFEDERFQVTREVARGGMGRILAAIDRRLGRTVAIKVALTGDSITQQRLGREAAILSSLDHPSLPPIHELGRLPNGLSYFVTRLVDGQTLEQRLRAEPRAWRQLLPRLVEVAEVVHAVHGAGVLHRDLKPSNILVEGDRVVIVDWGIAIRTRPPEHDTGPEAMHDLDITAPGTAIGTPGYWSPEQRRGEPGDVTSDVYSLGAIAFRMAVGWPSRGQVPQGRALENALEHEPRWLVALIARATAPEPDDRHPSAAAFADELARGLGVDVRRPDVPGRRAPLLGGAALGVTAVLALLTRDVAPCRAADTAPVLPAALSAQHWDGDFGEMAFAVSGDYVRAVYAHDRGLFIGHVVGDDIVGRWCERPYRTAEDQGDATFHVSVDATGTHLAGRYRYDDDGEGWSGRWNLSPSAGRGSEELTRRLAEDTWRCGSSPP